ncbi:MAG: hypothetical protein ABIP27_17385 [Flavobacterium circumlabens]|uniref:hypothetical protein n=1 Tax=Flavobacterium circumlabens TaxID=2133765 RepID=UPI00326735EA
MNQEFKIKQLEFELKKLKKVVKKMVKKDIIILTDKSDSKITAEISMRNGVLLIEKVKTEINRTSEIILKDNQ